MGSICTNIIRFREVGSIFNNIVSSYGKVTEATALHQAQSYLGTIAIVGVSINIQIGSIFNNITEDIAFNNFAEELDRCYSNVQCECDSMQGWVVIHNHIYLYIIYSYLYKSF